MECLSNGYGGLLDQNFVRNEFEFGFELFMSASASQLRNFGYYGIWAHLGAWAKKGKDKANKHSNKTEVI